VTIAAAKASQSRFNRWILPGLGVKAVVIGGGYATGRELAEFFLSVGPWGGLYAILFATLLFSVFCSLTFVLARRLATYDYRSFFKRLLGPAWPLFELSYLLFVVLILAVYGAAAGAIGKALFYAPEWVGTITLAAGIAGVVAFGNRAVERLFRDVSYYLYAVYAAFIIASRRSFERKMVSLFRTRDERQEAVAAFQRIRNGVEQYLWVQTMTGLIIAVASYFAMLAIGLNDAAFWAFLIFLVAYIPVIGGLLAMFAPPLFALLQFDGLLPAIVLLGVLFAIGTVVGNVIYPRMQGRSLNMDPVVVLLALAFWGAIWGLAGAFLSTPLTVMAMVVLAQFEGTRWIAVLLSADGNPQQLKDAPADRPPDAGRKNAHD